MVAAGTVESRDRRAGRGRHSQTKRFGFSQSCSADPNDRTAECSEDFDECSESIASSKAWQVLDVADPIGLALRVPRVILPMTSLMEQALPLSIRARFALPQGRKGSALHTIKSSVQDSIGLRMSGGEQDRRRPILSGATNPSGGLSTMFKETSRRLWRRLLQEFQDLVLSCFDQLRCCQGH